MLKSVLIDVFKFLGLILVSGIIWGLCIGWYVQDTAEIGIFPSTVNKSVYESATDIYASRMYHDLGNAGTMYSVNTNTIWTSANGSSYEA